MTAFVVQPLTSTLFPMDDASRRMTTNTVAQQYTTVQPVYTTSATSLPTTRQNSSILFWLSLLAGLVLLVWIGYLVYQWFDNPETCKSRITTPPQNVRLALVTDSNTNQQQQQQQVRVSWDKVPRATSYRVYRGTTSQVSPTRHDQVVSVRK